MNLARPQFTPPGGLWFYEEPNTKRQFATRNGLDDVWRQVVRFLEANKELVPNDLLARIEDYMCRRLPKGTCTGQDDRPIHETVPLFFEVSNAMDTFFQKNRGKLSYCDSNESVKRMRICIRCPRHFMGLCTSCDGLRATARSYVGHRTTVLDSQAGACSIFRLPLVAIVHVNNLTRNEHCPGECWVSP